MTLLLWAALSGCNDPGFAAVSIDPIYGWVDGCTTIQISGHGFDKDVKATIAGNAVTNVTLPTREVDIGYTFAGTLPAGKHGYADIEVTSGGESSVLTGTAGYYYVECPETGVIDTVGPQQVVAGDGVTIVGCGLDAASRKVRLFDSTGAQAGDDIVLASNCGTAKVSFAAPALADGTYYIAVVDESGNVVAGGQCAPPDSADTAYSCTEYTLTYAPVAGKAVAK